MVENLTQEQQLEITKLVAKLVEERLAVESKKPLEVAFKKTLEDVQVPLSATDGSAGYDLFAPIDFVISSKYKVCVDLGFAMAIPEGYAAIICPRSGLGCKDGTVLRNTIGLIDSDYRDTWYATMHLDGLPDVKSSKLIGTDDGVPNKELHIKKGERFAQLFFVPYKKASLNLVDSLDETGRTGGLGSTGN